MGMTGQTHIIRQIDIIHTTLIGMALICLTLLCGLLLPMFGIGLNSPAIAAFVVVVVLIGMGTLYFLNFQAHKIVQAQARLTDVLINSLGQGFLTFDAQGICGNVYSQACHNLLLAEEIADQHIADILRVPDASRNELDEWLGILFMPDHALSFEDAVRFLPDSMLHEDGRLISLTYRSVRDDTGALVRIVLIATDHTEEKEAQKRVDAERQFAAMICAIVAERHSFIMTMGEMRDVLEALANADESVLTPDFFRTIHTLKGTAMHFKMEKLGEMFHMLETTLKGAAGRPIDEVRELLNQSRAEVQLEFGRIQNALRVIIGDEEQYGKGLIEVDEESVYRFGRMLKQQDVPTEIYYAYQQSILSVPLFSLLKTLDRQMLPLAEQLDKKVKPLQFRGEAVRVPARPLKHFLMSLTHVVRNVLDHGIEAPITRMAKGKDPQGEMAITVNRVTDEQGIKWLEIIISDDGAGIDPNKVRAKLAEREPEGAWRSASDQDVIQHLLTADLSTKDEVSMISGRGVGMAAVYHEVMRLGGRCELRSELHKGTDLVIRLPEDIETRF